MFLSENLKYQFENQGFVKTELLSASQVASLLQLFHKTKALSGIQNHEFYTSIWSNNPEYKKLVGDGIKEILVPQLKNVLLDFKPVFANFMVKLSGANSALQPHQDWSFVDENQFDSITVWLPLKDVDAQNGALEVFPKSHFLKNKVRARFADAPFSQSLDYLKSNCMQGIPMKAGEALFVNSRTIHASPPNKTPEDRIAISMVVIPQNATMLHFVKDNQDDETIYQFEVNEEFFETYSCFDYPTIPSNHLQLSIPSNTFQFHEEHLKF